jgi:hypothetical protein
MRRLALLPAALALAAGCSSNGAGPAGTVFGGVNVELIKDAYTAFLGVFYDAPPLPMTPLDMKMSQGGCQLLVPREVSCTQPCGAGTVCTGANVCSAKPAQIDVGTLHVEGLGPTALDLMPTSPTVLSYQVVPTLPYPACAEGDAVTLDATAFSIAGKCVTDLEVTSAVPIPVMSGQPMHLAWKAPGHAGISRVQIILEISHHGGYRGEIDCDVADTGSFDVPAPLVTALVALGRAGFPTVKVARTATAAAAKEPGVKLVVGSQVELEVDTGVISCGAPTSQPCPDGTTCQGDFTCQ